MTILDVRERYEFDICSIEAIQIPMGEIVDRLSEIPRDKKIAVLCRSGKRAEAVANLLITEHNFNDVVVVEGGILAWIDKYGTHQETY